MTSKEIFERGLKIEEKLTTIRGIVTASDWDDNDNVIQLKIHATDEQEYLVENGIFHIDMLRKLVQARGFIRKASDGKKSFEIKSWKVIGQWS